MADKKDILNKYNNKEDRIFVANILDKIVKFNKRNILVTTNFLDLNKFKITIELLNKYKVKYKVFSLDEVLERRCIALVPEYLDDYNFDCISCIKVISNNKLLHKDYMGSIYNIGINEDMIGDIIVYENYAYIFLINKVLEYIEFNYTKVGNEKVKIEVLDIDSIKNLTYSFEEKNIVVKSNRIDIILAHVYNLSRNDVEKKINKNELYINSKCIKNKTYILKENDIVSFRRCGKFKYINMVKKTKNKNLVVKVTLYS